MRVPLECVPDPDVPGCGNAFLTVTVDEGSVRAALDTGAPRTSLIDLPPSARPVGSRETSGAFGTEVVTEWEVGEISVGDLRVGPLTVDHLPAGAGRHSVLGLDVLSTGPWQLDLARETLLTGEPLSRGSVLRRAANGHLLTQMAWSGVTATALWDTGAGITLIDRRFAEAHRDLFVFEGAANATDVLGSTGDLRLARVSGYEIDGIGFAGHVVAVAELPGIPDRIDAAIGFPTITQARWAVDLPAGLWRIER